ncbi:MAG: hypothetical protein R6U27_17775 [Desulfobacterales bacterium]
MGSRVFAQRAKEKNMDIRAMISLEMVGYFSETEAKQAFPLPLMNFFYSTTSDFIAVVGNLKSGKLVKQVAKGLRKGCIQILGKPFPLRVNSSRALLAKGLLSEKRGHMLKRHYEKLNCAFEAYCIDAYTKTCLEKGADKEHRLSGKNCFSRSDR